MKESCKEIEITSGNITHSTSCLPLGFDFPYQQSLSVPTSFLNKSVHASLIRSTSLSASTSLLPYRFRIALYFLSCITPTISRIAYRPLPTALRILLSCNPSFLISCSRSARFHCSRRHPSPHPTSLPSIGYAGR